MNFQIYSYIQSILLEKNNVWQISGPHSAGPVCIAHRAHPIATPLIVYIRFCPISGQPQQPVKISSRSSCIRDKVSDVVKDLRFEDKDYRTRTCKLILEDARGQGLSSRTTALDKVI